MSIASHFPRLQARRDQLAAKSGKTHIEQMEWKFLSAAYMMIDVIQSLENGDRGYHSWDIAMVEAYARDLAVSSEKSREELKKMEGK